MTDNIKFCKGTTTKKTLCKNHALKNSDFCRYHQPEQEKEKEQIKIREFFLNHKEGILSFFMGTATDPIASDIYEFIKERLGMTHLVPPVFDVKPQPSPTPKPKPWTTIGFTVGNQTFEMKMPFTTVEGIGEVVDFEHWSELPILSDIAHLSYWHETLRKVTSPNGRPLITPFPADVEKATWDLVYPGRYDIEQGMGINFLKCPYEKQPLKIIGGFKYCWINIWMIGVTVQIAHPQDRSLDRIATGIISIQELQNWHMLNKQIGYPKPRIGMPVDKTSKDANIISANFYNFHAYYLAFVGAFDPISYKKNMIQWDSDEFPPAHFSRYPYIGGITTLSNQQ